MRCAFPPYGCTTRSAFAPVVLEALRLDENAGDFGELGLDRALDVGDGGLDLGGGDRVVEIEAERDQDLARSKMHGEDLVDPDDPGSRPGDPLDFAAHLGEDRLAGQEALALIGEKTR